MKFFIELNLEADKVTEMTIFESEIYRCEFIDPNVDKPVDIRQAVQWIKEDLDYYAE